MRKLLIAGMAALLTGCATPYHDNGQATRDAYEARLDALAAQLDAGQLTHVEVARQAAHVAREIYPTDYQLHAVRDYKIYLAERFERGDITEAEYQARWSEKINGLLAERQAQFQAQQAANQRAADYMTMQQLGRIQDRMRPAAPVTCTSSNSFGITTTNCR